MIYDLYVCLECSESEDDKTTFLVEAGNKPAQCPQGHQEIFLKKLGQVEVSNETEVVG